MTFEELLEQFRALGGIAENVRLGSGQFGLGLFSTNSDLPVSVSVPPHLLVPIEDISIVENQVRVNPNASVGAAERTFFETYHRHFAWGAGGFETMWRQQEGWHALPEPVINYLKTMGVLENAPMRFLSPTVDLCLRYYITSRDFLFRGQPHMAPILDMANHSSVAPGYGSEGTLALNGRFPGEVFARYNMRDALANAESYSFSHLSLFAYSVQIAVDAPGGMRLSVRRSTAETDVKAGVRFPRIVANGNDVNAAFLQLGDLTAPDLPRAIARKMLSPWMPAHVADDVFDGILHFNRKKVLDLLRLLEPYDGEIVVMLRRAAVDQLEALSANVGARAL